jgi:hypothetical protein
MGCSVIGSCSVLWGEGERGRHVYTITTTRKEKKRKEKRTVFGIGYLS